MIGRLRGEVIERSSDEIVVDVGGVGYQLAVAARHHYALGSQVDVHVHTHVREDEIRLFGFPDALERDVFHLLIAVPNIGPVKAMQIMATPVAELYALIAKRDVKGLSKLPGVGKKTAERMLVDLADKMAQLGAMPAVAGAGAMAPEDPRSAELTSALLNLGFKLGQAEGAVESVLGAAAPATSTEELLKACLGQLAR